MEINKLFIYIKNSNCNFLIKSELILDNVVILRFFILKDNRPKFISFLFIN